MPSDTSTMPPDSKPAKPEIPAAQIEWVRQFSKAGASPRGALAEERSKVIGVETDKLVQSPELLAGLKLDLTVRANATIMAQLLSVVGKQQKMTTLTGTGDAMKEFDTVHDGANIDAVDGEKLIAAGKSLQVVVEAAKKVETRMMALYLADAGLDLAKLEQMEEALKLQEKAAAEARKKRKAVGVQDAVDAAAPAAPAFTKAELDKFAEARAKVMFDVREEVWQPLVRQGLIPENFVPDLHSEAQRTFEGASDRYQARLEAFTEQQGENANLRAGLKVAKDIAEQTVKVVSAASGLSGIPTDVAGHIDTAASLLTVLSNTGFAVADQVLSKADATDILATVSTGINQSIAALGVVPPEVTACVQGGLALVLNGARAAKAVQDGNAQGVINAIGAALNQSMSIAGTVTGAAEVKLAGKAVEALVKTSGAAAGVVAALKKPIDKQKVKDAIGELVKESMAAAGQAVQAALEAEARHIKGGDKTVKAVNQALDIAVPGAGALIAGALSEDKVGGMATALSGVADQCCSTWMDKAYSKQVGSALKVALGKQGQSLGRAILARDASGVATAVIDVVGAGLEIAAKKEGLDPKAKLKLEQVSAGFKSGNQVLAGLGALVEALKNNNAAGVQKALESMLDSAVQGVGTQLGLVAATGGDEADEDAEAADDAEAGDDEEEGEDEDEDEDEDGEIELAGEEAVARQAAYEADLQSSIAKLSAALADAPPDKQAGIKQKRDQALLELLEQEKLKSDIEAETAVFLETLNTATSPNDDDDIDDRSLTKMIAALERQQTVLKLVNSMSGMGLTALAHFVPAAGAALDFKNFLVEVALAVAHLRELLKWKKSAGEARNAVTVQMYAMLNRVKLETDAEIEHQIKAALALTSAIGQVVAQVGAHAAPVGVAMVATAKAGTATLELALKIKSAVEMELAWRNYKTALDNPGDRKAIRIALKTNATMSKYAMVWGALKDNNPMAKKALKRCGLTDAIIEKERANEELVVKYLEVLYRDDPVVLRAIPDMTGWGWTAPAPELTVRGWAAFLATAQNEGRPKMQAGSGGSVTTAIGALVKAKAVLARSRGERRKQQRAIDAESKKAAESLILTDGEEREKAKAANEARMAILTTRLDAMDTRIAKQTDAVKAALEAVGKAATTMKPLDKDGRDYPRVKEYMGSIKALTVIETRELEAA